MLRKLKNQLRVSYSSIEEDVARTFYDPVLREAISYKRVSGYFSSKALALYAEGLDELAENANGHVQFIISQNISQNDFEQIKAGYVEKSKQEVLTEADKVRLGNLAFLIAQGIVDIKFGLVAGGLFHTKWGLFEDAAGETVYFSGSFNETANAFNNNYDSFDVDVSWDISQHVRERIENKRVEFERLWHDQYEHVQVVDAADVVYPLIQQYDQGMLLKPKRANTIILDIDSDSSSYFFNDTTKTHVSEKRSFKTKFTAYVDKIKQYPYFRDSLTYRDLEKIIARGEKQAERNHVFFEVSAQVRKLIESQRYSIEEYRKAGLTLKAADDRWKTELNQFREVVQSEVERPLKELQIRSAFYMYTQKRAANFSVPGSGKTAMLLGVYAYLNSLAAGKLINRILVICPLNAFGSWQDEFHNVFGAKKKLTVLNIHGDDIQGDIHTFENNWPGANLILVNYESLQKLKGSLKKCLSRDSDTMLVFDEVHRIKGVDAQRAQAALDIVDKVDYRYVLTGTPIPNSYLDIYNFLHILFKNEYTSFFGFDQSELKDPDPAEVRVINAKLAPFFWRTNKDDLGVPKPDKDIIIKVPASEEQLQLAEFIYTELDNPLATMIRMLQLSTNPSLVDKAINYSDLGYSESDTVDKVEYSQVSDTLKVQLEQGIQEALLGEMTAWNLESIESPKLERGIKLIKEILQKQKKVIVWGLFVDTLKSITDRLKRDGVHAEVIYGGTTRQDRDQILSCFKQDNDDIQVLVSNPNTLGESISLHKLVHDAVYFEYNFNLTFMLQSRDRIHRLGLPADQHTRYYYLMTSSEREYFNFIDGTVYDRLKEKAERMKKAIDGDLLVPEFADNEIEEMKQVIAAERHKR